MLNGPPYHDLWIRCIGSLLWAHFVRSLGGPGNLLTDLVSTEYYSEVAGGATVTFLVWEWIRQLSMRLDRRYDWLEKSLPRILLQLVFGWMLPAMLAFLLMVLFFRFIVQFDIFQTPWLHFEYPVCVLFLLMLNGYYLAFYFYNRLQHLTQKQEHQRAGILSSEPPGGGLNTLIVSKGNRHIPTPVDQVACCFIRDESTFLKTFEGQTFLVPQTLDEMTASLPARSFFRANRQTLVHFRACESFKNIENGKLELSLHPAHHEPVIVSQKKAKEFRDWIGSR